MFGVITLDKPPGITSRAALDMVERLVRPEKAGHAGTLDPLATGVLVVCVGPITRLIDRIQALGKRYTATFELGCSSPSDDRETEITWIADARRPTREEIEASLPKFRGVIQQVPPIYSAIKVDGRRAHRSARKGRTVELAARPVVIHRLEIRAYEYPRLELEIECGSGTYVRSLGRDLATELGTAAVMTDLIRTAIGPLTMERTVSPKLLNRENIAAHLSPPQLLFPHIPRVELRDIERIMLTQGRVLPELSQDRFRYDVPPAPQFEEVFAEVPGGRLFAILARVAAGGWAPKTVFPLALENPTATGSGNP